MIVSEDGRALWTWMGLAALRADNSCGDHTLVDQKGVFRKTKRSFRRVPGRQEVERIIANSTYSIYTCGLPR